MITLQSYVHTRLVTELAQRVLGVLSSISEAVPPAKLEAIVAGAVGQLGRIEIRANNDLGMLITRVLERATPMETSTTTPAEVYAQARAGDEFIDVYLHDLAYTLGGILATQLNMLRDTVPSETNRLVADITAAAPTHAAAALAPPQIIDFTWGRLNETAYRDSVLLLCRERCNVFKSPTPMRYYTDAILDRLLEKMPADLGDAMETQRTKLLDAVVAAGGLEGDLGNPNVAAFVDVLTRRHLFARFFGQARLLLTGNADSTLAIVAMIDQAAAFARYVDGLMAATLDGMPRGLGDNLRTLQDALMLLHGAVLNVAATQFEEALIIAANPQAIYVNPPAHARFTASGGTDTDLINHLQFMRLAGLTFTLRGVTLGRVLELKDTANATVVKTEAERRTSQELAEQGALGVATKQALDAWATANNPGNLPAADHTVLHERLRDRALAGVGKDGISLYDLVTEYLVGMRGSPLLTNLYAALAEAFVGIMPDGGGVVSEEMRMAAFCQATSAVLGRFLVGQYGAE